MNPRVHVYTVCWNEERFLPYFLRHYATFAERITVFDNMSDDRSAEIVRGFPGATLQTFDTGGTFRDDVHRDIKNNAWKQSRGQADWVICVDTDELLWHPRLADYLASCKKRSITIMVPTGYEMLAEAFPTTAGQVYDEVKHGALNVEYSKPCIFNPDAIAEINYIPGAHKAQPVGLVIAETQSELKLLHFRFLGVDYTLERFAAKRARLSEENRRWGWAMQYEMPPEKIRAYMNRFQPRRVQVVP
jgi:glycosyltransferase involved in cell wall biosynthesis